jgi:hypothetical protein
MLKPTITTLACLMPVMALVSCAAPKAIVVESPLAPKLAQAAISEPATKPKIPALQNDGLRLPDMETMPGDDEFHAAKKPPAGGDADSGAVISRPPTEPPAKPKPKAE